MTSKAELKRRVRARMAKTGESYTTARASLLAARGVLPAALHMTNGDSAAGTLRQTRVAGTVLPWRDVLHEGPVPAVSEAQLRRIRADFLAFDAPGERDGILRGLEERDRTLAAHAAGAYVLWFEADLYDQLQLIQVLARLAELRVPPERVTLICIGEYLGIAHFGGLGELEPAQLEGLADSAASDVTDAGFALAREAWAALRADDPRGLAAIARTFSPELRFLAEAFDRLSREYPSTRDGLSLTERRILAAAAGGASTAGAIFADVGARETRPFLGDLFCFRTIGRLATGPAPLLESPAPRMDRATRIELTPAGRDVLEGEADAIGLNAIDRWVGGFHLSGAGVGWRWDEGSERIRAQPGPALDT